MEAVSAEELAKISYIDLKALDDRSILMMPFWDGTSWHMWTEASPGSIIELQIVDAAHSNYIATMPAKKTDMWIEFVDHMWQRANWPEISRIILGIQDDFHLLATSVAKLRHFFETRATIDQTLLSSFIKTELEYLITVARSVFDLLQEALANIWNNRIQLLDPTQEATRKRHKLPDKFTKMAVLERGAARPIDEMIARYAIPHVLAEQYHHLVPFYVSLLSARDKIIHGGGSVETIFVTEKGFCVDRRAKTFADFDWKSEHNYNETLVSLLPWVAHVVFGTIQACNDVMGAFSSVFAMPPKIAPDYRIFIRDPANEALGQLADAANGNLVWWCDTISVSLGAAPASKSGNSSTKAAVGLWDKIVGVFRRGNIHAETQAAGHQRARPQTNETRAQAVDKRER